MTTEHPTGAASAFTYQILRLNTVWVFLQILWFPPTVQEHTTRSIGDAKLSRRCTAPHIRDGNGNRPYKHKLYQSVTVSIAPQELSHLFALENDIRALRVQNICTSRS